MGGTKDEDSAVRKFIDNRLQELAAMRVMQLNPLSPFHSTSPSAESPKRAATHHPTTVSLLAIVAVCGPLLGGLLGATWSGGGAEKTLAVVESGMADIKEDFKLAREDRIAQAIAMKELSTEVKGLRKDNLDLVVGLAQLGALQNDQGLLVIRLEVEAGAARDDRGRMQTAANEAAYKIGIHGKYLSTLRQQMDLLWTMDGLEPLRPKEDG